MTSLQRLVAHSQWTHSVSRPDGTCTLCRNALQKDVLQSLPPGNHRLACPRSGLQAQGGQVRGPLHRGCGWEAANRIQNNWQVGLDVSPSQVLMCA